MTTTMSRQFHPSAPATVRTVCALGVVGAVSSGCVAEPYRQVNEVEVSPVQVMVDSSDQEQVIMGELYSRALASRGRQTFVDFEYDIGTAERIQAVETNHADIVVVCLGTALEALNPARAKELSQDYTAKIDAGEITPTDIDFSETVLDSLLGSLPRTVHNSNFSPTHGCAESEDLKLPQNFIVLYQRPLLNRKEWDKLNVVNGAISEASLKEIAEELNSGEDQDEVYSTFLSSNRVLSNGAD
ncbi:hypothetical protein [Corynebacterium sp. 11A]|uniref:hypothetical protein n=1 Tax=Corynebacterium sp. 11A TaxID=2080510 RepID=UPI00124E9319|nr:hypothetical protein [Corynebacterium sp. 11A]